MIQLFEVGLSNFRVIVGAAPAALGIILGVLRLLIKKKPLRKLGKTEIIIGIVLAVVAILISVYVYTAGVMNIDFVKIVREDINLVFLHK